MVEISEIEDSESLEAWLEGQPGEHATIITARSALRVLPLFWDWSLSSQVLRIDSAVLPVLRSNLVASVACKFSTPQLNEAARAAARSVHVATKAVYSPFGASAAASASAYGVLSDCRAALLAGRALGDSQRRNLWENIRKDCKDLQLGNGLEHTPLWQVLERTLWGASSPLEDFWEHLLPKVLSAKNSRPGDWQFWVDWYEQMLDPVANPPKWELLEQVALIEPEVWEAGPEAVSEAIAVIQLGFAERALATGERFEYDEGRDLFVRNPVPAEDKATLKYCVARLAELSELAETMGNMQGILGGELFFIRRAVENHADNPVMVWDNCGNAMRMLQSNLASGACPADEPYVTILQATLTDVRIKLERDPAVQHVAPHRPEIAPIDDDDAVEVVTDALDVIAEVVEPDVAEEIEQDRATLLDRFASAGRRTAAFITGAARIVGIVVAAIPGALLGVMDYGVAFSERLIKLTENAGKISKNIRTIILGGVVSTGAVTTAASPEKIPQALEAIVKIFGG